MSKLPKITMPGGGDTDTFMHGLETAIGAIDIGIQEGLSIADIREALQDSIDRLKLLHGDITI